MGKSIPKNIFNTTVEPLLKDTPNKGHDIFNLSIKDKCPYSITAIHSKENDDLCIAVILGQYLLPKCSLFTVVVKFYCVNEERSKHKDEISSWFSYTSDHVCEKVLQDHDLVQNGKAKIPL